MVQHKFAGISRDAMRRHALRYAVVISIVMAGVLSATNSHARPLSGAIFTTVVDGTRVNANIYEAREDVYLDGGPGPNAPPTAAGLPEGDYYFQVTDPSGKTLLSTDPIECRRFHVNDLGWIDGVISSLITKKVRGQLVEVECKHATGIDVDQGATTVQLMPYNKTPNRGGVYKVWVTPVDDYVGHSDPNHRFHGFVPACSKTDNYKVRTRKPTPDQKIDVRKFHDANVSCDQDEGESDIAGWPVEVTTPLGVTNLHHTPFSLMNLGAKAGDQYVIKELQPSGIQTTSYLDGQQLSCYPNADPVVVVTIDGGKEDEVHSVVYGNVGPGSVTACKFYDANGNGTRDDDEQLIEGWRMILSRKTVVEGVDVLTELAVDHTDANGCVTFDNLLPGEYCVTEVMANPITTVSGDIITWEATTALTQCKVIVSEIVLVDETETLAGTAAWIEFGNICKGTVDFGTKGYWHNKNGLAELTEDNVAEVNALAPYNTASSYFEDGDEPFDGLFDSGAPVAAAFSSDSSIIWGAGTYQSEISHFLTGSNAGGDPREQLAQQLLAFFFNVQYRLGGMCGSIEVNGEYVDAQSLINTAVELWSIGPDDAINSHKSLLDYLNNQDALPIILCEPCPVIYND